MSRHILVTGGGGYVGSSLVPRLLCEGYRVTVIDLMIYGDEVFSDKVYQKDSFTLIKSDIRNTEKVKKAMISVDVVIHLACISNDPSFELDPELGKSINLDAFIPLVQIAKECGVARFINASSSSVYGVKEVQDVCEELDLEPLTDYSKYKAICEEQLLQFIDDDFTVVSVRPATVCGPSPRQRLDVIVNIFTHHAQINNRVLVFGGKQLRPNIHIEDMVDFYCLLLDAPHKVIQGQSYNIGSDNYSVKNLATIVSSCFDKKITLKTESTDDLRSYHISSFKAEIQLGFKTKRTIKDAANDLILKFKRGELTDSMSDEKYFNVKRMKSYQF